MQSRHRIFTSLGASLVLTPPAPPWPWASANMISVPITPSAQECYVGLPWWFSSKDEEIQHISLVSTSRLEGDRGDEQDLLPAWVKIRPEWFQEAFFFFQRIPFMGLREDFQKRCHLMWDPKAESCLPEKSENGKREERLLHAWGRQGDT